MAVSRSSKLGNPQAAFFTVWIFELIEVGRAFRTLKTIDLKVHPHTPSTPRPSARAHSAFNHANLRIAQTAAALLHRLGAVDSKINPSICFPAAYAARIPTAEGQPGGFPGMAGTDSLKRT